MAGNMIPPYGPRFGGAPPVPMNQPNPGMGLGQVFQRLRQGPPTGMDYMNLPFGAGEEAIPGVNVPQPERQPVQRNMPIQITPGNMTDAEPAAQQIMDLDAQMNENFGMGSGPLGQPMQEFPGRPGVEFDLDEIRDQLMQDLQKDIVGNTSPQDRVFKAASGLGRLRNAGLGRRG